jgi:hypothetical protein
MIYFLLKLRCANEKIKQKLRKRYEFEFSRTDGKIDKILCPLPSAANYVQNSGYNIFSSKNKKPCPLQ